MSTDYYTAQEDRKFTRLESKRLVLRRFQENDLPAFVSYRSQPAVARYQGWDEYSLTDAEKFFAAMQQRHPGTADGHWFQFAVTQRGNDQIIGDVAFVVDEYKPFQAETGYTFDPVYHGRGFATEAMSCLLDYLFGPIHLHRVIATVDPRNLRSIRLLERLGFRQEGYFVRALWFKNEWADDVLYAMLRDEWQTLRRSPDPQNQGV